MSEERVEPTLDLTVEGKSWNPSQETFTGNREPATVHVDPESEREVVELLRAMLALRLERVTAIIALKVSEIDFTSPALPARASLAALVKVFETATDAAAALREMSPDVWPDDEDDAEEDEPEPDQPNALPQPETTSGGER